MSEIFIVAMCEAQKQLYFYFDPSAVNTGNGRYSVELAEQIWSRNSEKFSLALTDLSFWSIKDADAPYKDPKLSRPLLFCCSLVEEQALGPRMMPILAQLGHKQLKDGHYMRCGIPIPVKEGQHLKAEFWFIDPKNGKVVEMFGVISDVCIAVELKNVL